MSYLDQITVGSTTYDLQDSDAQRKTITGSGAPTSSTVGEVGLHYFDTSAVAPPYEYVCTAASGSIYTWMPAGYGEDGDPGVYYGTTEPSDPDIKVWLDPSGSIDSVVIPSGGAAGQALMKSSSSNYDIAWGNIEALPSGGTTGQALLKTSSSNFEVAWGDIEALPSGGSSGQFLQKASASNYDVTWGDVAAIPSGGSEGQFLVKTSSTDYETNWSSLSGGLVPDGGTQGQALLKISSSNFNVGWTSIVNSINGMYGNINILPIKANITIASSLWSGSDPYTQEITINNAIITNNTKVDLQLDTAALNSLLDDGVTHMFIENNNTILTLYAFGAETTTDITAQVVYYETV